MSGDMFAATLVARLRQAAQQAGVMHIQSWKSDDQVHGPDLPLAKATEMVLASMHAILKDTADHYDQAAKRLEKDMLQELNAGAGEEASQAKDTQKHLRLTRAAEVRVVRNARMLIEPPNLESFNAQSMEIEADVDEDST